MVQATKLVMNSLSGKLGQRTFDRTVIMSHAHVAQAADPTYLSNLVYSKRPSATATHITKILDIGCDLAQVSLQTDPLEDATNPGSFVHLISFITAYARARLAKFEHIAGPKQVFYMDTDSLVVSADGYRRLASKPMRFDNKYLGALKLEHICSLFHAVSPKCYLVGEKVGEKYQWSAKSKGVDLRKIQDDAEKLQEFFVGACSRGELSIAQTRFVRKAGFVDI